MPTTPNTPDPSNPLVPVPAPPSRRGRRRKLDDVKQREVVAMITAGCGMQAAARYVGCAASTIRREAQRNTQFEQRIRNAFLTAELQPLDTIRKAAGTHWRAAAWLLERTNPHRYGRYHLRELKPDLLEAYSEQLAELLVDEIEDTQTARRIIRQMQRIGQRAAREAWLAERDLVLDMSDDIPDEIMDAP